MNQRLTPVPGEFYRHFKNKMYQIVTIAYCDDGELKTIQVRVRDGFASFFINELHTFVVLNGQYHVVTENGQQLLASDATGEVIMVNELL